MYDIFSSYVFVIDFYEHNLRAILGNENNYKGEKMTNTLKK
jgi:hypothetical protein